MNDPLIKAFLQAKTIEGLSRKSLAYYELEINGLQKYSQGQLVSLATTDQIREYLAYCLDKRGATKCTLDNKRRALSSFFQWLEDEEKILKNPIRRIKAIKQEKRLKKALTEEDIELLRQAVEGKRDAALVELFLSTGMRVGELVRLNREDIDFQSGEVVVFGKGDKERTTYLNAKSKLSLKNYLESRTDRDEALFVTLTKPFTRLTKGAVGLRLRTIKIGTFINQGFFSQIEHMKSEITEVEQAYEDYLLNPSVKNQQALFDELTDLQVSAQTAKHMVFCDKGNDIDSHKRVIVKNQARGYYDE